MDCGGPWGTKLPLRVAVRPVRLPDVSVGASKPDCSFSSQLPLNWKLEGLGGDSEPRCGCQADLTLQRPRGEGEGGRRVLLSQGDAEHCSP